MHNVYDWLLNRSLDSLVLLGKHSSLSLRLRFQFRFQFGPQATWSPSAFSFEKNLSFSLFMRVTVLGLFINRGQLQVDFHSSVKGLQ